MSNRTVAFSGAEANDNPEARADRRRASGTAGLIHNEAVPGEGMDGIGSGSIAVGGSVGVVNGVMPSGWKGVEVSVESGGATSITVGA